MRNTADQMLAMLSFCHLSLFKLQLNAATERLSEDRPNHFLQLVV